MAKNKYLLVEFKNKDKKFDIGIISSKWRCLGGLDILCPPPSVPTHMLAKDHVKPASTWKVCQVSKILETTSKLNNIMTI